MSSLNYPQMLKLFICHSLIKRFERAHPSGEHFPPFQSSFFLSKGTYDIWRHVKKGSQKSTKPENRREESYKELFSKWLDPIWKRNSFIGSFDVLCNDLTSQSHFSLSTWSNCIYHPKLVCAQATGELMVLFHEFAYVGETY